MNDYKKKLKAIPHVLSLNGIFYPNIAIGTFGMNKQELVELFNNYPYDELLIDTAYRYGNEVEVATALQESEYPKRNVLYIGKINYAQQSSGISVRENLEGTLRRLQISKIHTYLIHSPRYKDYCDTWDQMITLQEEGLIDNIGVSNFSIKEIESMHKKTNVYPSVNQIVYCPFFENKEEQEKIIEYCDEKNILIQVAMPFGGKENRNNITREQRRNVLMDLHKRKMVAIIGTTQVAHMIENFHDLEEFENAFQIKN